MRYGVCTWIFGDEPLEETCIRLAAQGYDGVELPGDLGHYQPAVVRSILSAHGLAVLSITPANEDLAHPDRTVRGQALDYYLRLLDFAVAVGSPIASCHGAVGRVRAIARENGTTETGQGSRGARGQRSTPAPPHPISVSLW